MTSECSSLQLPALQGQLVGLGSCWEEGEGPNWLECEQIGFQDILLTQE